MSKPTPDEIKALTGYEAGSLEDKLLTIFDGIYQNGLQDGQTGLDYLTYKVDEAIAYTKLLIGESNDQAVDKFAQWCLNATAGPEYEQVYKRIAAHLASYKQKEVKSE